MIETSEKLKINVFTGGLDLRSAKGESLSRFAKGLLRCGEDVHLIERCKYNQCDIAVIFGEVKNHKKRASRMRLKSEIIGRHINKGLIVIDTPIITRSYPSGKLFRRVGINGILRDTGDFYNDNMPPERWKKISRQCSVQLKPWNIDGDSILFALQRPFDASLKGVEHIRPHKYKRWILETCKEIYHYSAKPIVIRPHPESRVNIIEKKWIDELYFELKNIPRLHWDKEVYLTDSLSHAYACVTYNSGSSVDAAILGVPVFCGDSGSFAWDVSSKAIENIVEPSYPDRTQWLNNLSYVEWSLDEMQEGQPWMHLKPRLLEYI